jgi:Ca2+-binding RTX toxin-like protein
VWLSAVAKLFLIFGLVLSYQGVTAGTKIVNGSSGTDTLDIDYTGVDSLGDFTITYDSTNSYIVLTDANGGVIKFKNIENLTVGNYAYTRYQDRDDDYGDAYWNATEAILYLWDGNGSASTSSVLDPDDDEALPGLTKTMDVTVYGSDGIDYFNLNINRTDSYTGNWTLVMGAGNDNLGAAALINGDSVDMGAGDDEVGLMINSHTPTVANLSLVKFDGGAGTDTLSFLNFTNTAEISPSTGGATNFENILGSGGSETIKGDANANILAGAGAADTLYGYAGNDILAGSNRGMPTLAQVAEWDADNNDSWNDDGNTGNNTLYGGAGDDKLYGGYYDDTLDGGTGADTLWGGNGSDTFIIRAGDGGSSISDADVLKDFSDTNDIIGMSGLQYSDLTIEQGSGDYSNHVIVKESDTGEFLTIIQNTSLGAIDDNDFTAI